MRALSTAAALVVLACPAVASASTVSVRLHPGTTGEEVLYVAAPGEANRLVVTYAADSKTATVSDTGAGIGTGDSCSSIDAHSARCTLPAGSASEFLINTQADLGDLGDEALVVPAPGATFGGIAANGGPGDDRLEGAAGVDQLDGGDGRDTLLGHGNVDRLSDGGAPGPDVLDGGPDVDALTYENRTAGVSVDLAAGNSAEGDTIRGIENVTGGRGGDRLSGDDGDNTLVGGPGNDRLSAGGNRNHDELRGDAGNDTLKGGAGISLLAPGSGLDVLACSHSGTDQVSGPEPGELLTKDCDRADLSFGTDGEDSFAWRPAPAAAGRRAVVLRLGCPQFAIDDGEFKPCAAKVTIVEAGGRHRVLGRGKYKLRTDEAPGRARVRLTRLGRRLARRGRGVEATATVRGKGFPHVSWTTILTTRR